MDKKSVAKISVIILIGLVLSVSIYFVLADEPPEPPQQSISRTASTDTSCISIPETREIIQENQCLDWDERNWTDINCDQYNRKPNNNCNIYSNYKTEQEINCSQYNIIGNRTNSSTLGDTPRSIMNCIKDANSEWNGIECRDICEVDIYCELSPSSNLSETDYICEYNNYFDNYESGCNNLDGCSWDDDTCNFDIYDYSQDETDCLNSNCLWENNYCFDDIENFTYCAGGYGNVIRDEIINKQQCTKTLYSGLMNYFDGESYVPINGTIVNSDDPLFDYEVETGEYFAYFKDDPTEGQVVKVVKNTTEITFQPMALNYRNDLSQIEQISMIQSVTGNPNINEFKYENAYGNGLDLLYSYYNENLKEELVINQSTDIPTPTQYILDGGNVTLDLDFIIESDSKIFIDNVEWDKSSTKETSNEVYIKDENNNIVYYLPKPYAYDSNNSQQLLTYQFKKQGNSLYVIIRTSYSWLNDTERVYPVVIDPTVFLRDVDSENLADTYVDSSNSDTNYGDVDPIYISSSRMSYFMFNISSIPSNKVITDSTFCLFTESDGTEDTYITYVYELDNRTWNESEITWNSRPTEGSLINSTIVDNAGLTVGTSIKFCHNVENWVDTIYSNGYNNISFFENSSSLSYINSKEDSIEVIRPSLNITYYDLNNITISDCTILDEENATYYLTSDITGSSTSNCMDITANNVVLDCQGHTIDGNDAADTGINVVGSNATIKNCILTDWDTYGIYLDGGEGTVEDTNLSSNPDRTIYIDSDSNILQNIFTTGGSWGIFIDQTENDNYLENITSYSHSRGIEIYNAQRTTIKNSNISGSTYLDIDFDAIIYCNHILENVNGTGNKPILFYNNTQTNITHWNNNVSQIILCNTSNSIINNLTLNQNGLVLAKQNDTQIINSSFNNVYYVFVYASHNTILKNITINSSTYSLYYRVAKNNTLKDSTIVDSSIRLYGSSTKNNYFYNNLFNMSAYTSNYDVQSNYWNTTKQSGTRIIGNGLIGGNYYANNTGGYSDTCTDANYDGFCDSSLEHETDNIDYLPLSDEYSYIHLPISPTSGQTFTEDEPTARFNISTDYAMDVCYWTIDSGVSNYTMTAVNTTYFWDENITMVDGAHTVNFYCNLSSDGSWKTYPVGITFDVDSVNVTVCRDLSVVDRVYYLQEDVIGAGDCVTLTTSNITLDGNGYSVNATSGDAVVIDGGENCTVQNIEINSLADDCIIIVEDGATLINITTIKCNDDGIVAQNDNLIIYNSSIVADDVAYYGFPDDVLVYNTIFSGGTYDLNCWLNCINNTFINSTYTTVSITSESDLTRKWYFETNITDENGVDLEDANVTIYNITGTYIHSELTDSSGEIGKEEVIDYINNGGVKTYHTPHTINVSLSGYVTNSTIVNLTSETNVVHHIKLITILSAEIYYPTDYLWISDNSSMDLNFTYTNVTELDTCLFTLDNYVTNTTITNCVNTTFDKEDGNYLLKLWINDTTGTATSDSVNFTIDSTYPLISYGTGTEDNETNFTRTWIYVNLSVTETNEKNITFRLYYKNGTQKNSTTYTDETITRTINWTGLLDGFYNYNVTIYDNASNVNSTLTRRIGLDNTPPSLNLYYPLAQSYSTNLSLPLNYTVSDATLGVQSCWYRIINSTSDIVLSNTTLSNCANVTFNVSQGEGTFTLTLYSNDSLNNINSSSETFGISLIAPATVLDYPTSDLWFNSEQNIYFNFTSTDTSGLDTCELYGNWTGTWHKNYTWKEPNSAVQNYTILNLTNVEAIWNVWCNDTLNNGDWGLDNLTFGVDTIFPTINLSSITTTQNSKIIYFNSNTSDTNTLSCKYSIFHTNGSLDGTNENISYTCNAQGLATVQGPYRTYNLAIYSSDLASNENKTTDPFTISQSPITGSGGGGNGEPEEEEEEINITITAGICGNGICESGETFANCPFDCGEFNLDDLIFSCFAGTPIGDWLDVEDTPEIKSRCITNQAPVLFWIFIITISGVSFVIIIEKQKKKGKIYKFPQYYETRRKAKSWLRRLRRKT